MDDTSEGDTTGTVCNHCVEMEARLLDYKRANARIIRTLNETCEMYEAYKRANERLAAERDEAVRLLHVEFPGVKIGKLRRAAKRHGVETTKE